MSTAVQSTQSASENAATQSMAGPGAVEAGGVGVPSPGRPRRHSVSSFSDDRFKTAVYKFNLSPSVGLSYLKKNNLLDVADERSVAEFLMQHSRSGLSFGQVGDFLGKGKPFNKAVLVEFVKLANFTGRSFLDALREFLQLFALPGEAQQIDRILNCFSEQYHENNPTVFPDVDAAFVFSFSTIMLNTELHNRNAKGTTLKGFLSLNSRSPHTVNLPESFQRDVYNELSAEALKFPTRDGATATTLTFTRADREGLLRHKGSSLFWKTRWYHLSDSCFYAFKGKRRNPAGPHLIMPLAGVTVSEVEGTKADFVIRPGEGMEAIHAAKPSKGNQVQQSLYTQFVMRAASGKDREEWIQAIRRNMLSSTMQEFVLKRSGSTSKVAGDSKVVIVVDDGGEEEASAPPAVAPSSAETTTAVSTEAITIALGDEEADDDFGEEMAAGPVTHMEEEEEAEQESSQQEEQTSAEQPVASPVASVSPVEEEDVVLELELEFEEDEDTLTLEISDDDDDETGDGLSSCPPSSGSPVSSVSEVEEEEEV